MKRRNQKSIRLVGIKTIVNKLKWRILDTYATPGITLKSSSSSMEHLLSHNFNQLILSLLPSDVHLLGHRQLPDAAHKKEAFANDSQHFPSPIVFEWRKWKQWWWWRWGLVGRQYLRIFRSIWSSSPAFTLWADVGSEFIATFACQISHAAIKGERGKAERVRIGSVDIRRWRWQSDNWLKRRRSSVDWGCIVAGSWECAAEDVKSVDSIGLMIALLDQGEPSNFLFLQFLGYEYNSCK